MEVHRYAERRRRLHQAHLTRRFSAEDSQLPGVVLRTPMFAMLDSLKSDDLTMRRTAEAWMRCSLKSYIRCVDLRTLKVPC